jgi:hypothetical protein
VRQNSLKETEFSTQEIYLTSWRPQDLVCWS